MGDRMSDDELREAQSTLTLAFKASVPTAIGDAVTILEDECERARESEARLSAAMEQINAIRNSIIACQTVNWSEHVYPLVEALNGAGFAGKPWPSDREHLGSVVQQRDAALRERDCAVARAKALEAALVRASRDFVAIAGLWSGVKHPRSIGTGSPGGDLPACPGVQRPSGPRPPPASASERFRPGGHPMSERMSDEEFTARLDKDLCGRGEHWCAAEARRARYEEERLQDELKRERSAWDQLLEEWDAERARLTAITANALSVARERDELRAENAKLREELERVAENRAELVDDVASAVAERDAERALVRQLREESARRLRGLKDAEATLRPEELPTGHRDLWSAAEYRMRELDAERARAKMAEQTRDGLLEENARLRAALEGLSGEKWWPDRQSRGPCWCAYNSADWFDHAPGCKRAAGALGHGEGVE